MLPPEDDIVISCTSNLARAIYDADGASVDDLREGVALLEALCTTSRRVYGAEHPKVALREGYLDDAQAKLAAAVAAAAACPEGSSCRKRALLLVRLHDADVLVSYNRYMLLDNRVLTRLFLNLPASCTQCCRRRAQSDLIDRTQRYKARLQPLHGSRQD